MNTESKEKPQIAEEKKKEDNRKILYTIISSIVLIVIAYFFPLQVNDLKEFYVILLNIETTLLGFTLAAISIILAFPENPRIQTLQNSGHLTQIISIYITELKYIMIALMILICGWYFLLNWIAIFIIFCVSLTAFQLKECLWILEQIIRFLKPNLANPVGLKQSKNQDMIF